MARAEDAARSEQAAKAARDELQQALEQWEQHVLAPYLQKAPERKPAYETLSWLPTKRLYTPLDTDKTDPLRDIGFPGEFPYTRGVYPTMYRGRLWTMRQFAGFGAAEDTNRRFRLLLEHGETGLSTAFDMPTLMGYDPDHAQAEGEVGRCGVSICCARDMERLFDQIPLGDVTVSMTINAPALPIFAFFLVAAERQGVPFERLGGTLQNDMLKEYIAQKEWAFPVKPSVKLVVDCIEFCTQHLPRWHPVSISGYHIREAGSTAVQELAFTLIDGLTYVEEAVARGLDIDEFAPRLSFFWDVHNEFFEEIAKMRAARRIWAREIKERYNPKNQRSLLLRTHCQTAGVSLTAQQPMNNLVRVALQALAAVLGGAQSVHTNALDETYALPTDESALLALRQQQIIAHETGVTDTIDPLGGSYYLETLTNEMEAGFAHYQDAIEGMGGMIQAVEQGYPQQEILAASARFQEEVERGERVIVGVNKFVTADAPIPLLRIDDAVERKTTARVQALRAEREAARWQASLQALQEAARKGENVLPALLEAARADATLGEVMDALRTVYGVYREPAMF